MLLPIAKLAATLLFVAPAVAGKPNVVQRCEEGQGKHDDDWLSRAIAEMRSAYPELTEVPGDACSQAAATTRALTRTFHRNYVRNLAGYEFAKVVSADSYFTVERFRLRRVADARRFAAVLEKCRFCKLATEDNTCLDHFTSGDSVVLMVSSATGCGSNKQKFARIRTSFLSLARP